MSEQSIAQARASVMLYNNERKEWEHSGGSSGISRVHVYHHPVNNTYRIVGRKALDHTVVINCALAKGLKYNEATPTFHQWRDQRQVYGLNFPSKEDAQIFGQAVNTALENLRSGGSAGIPQQPPMIQQQFMSSSHASNGRGNERDEMLAQIQDQPPYDAHEQYSHGRTAPSAVPDNRPYRAQYDAPRETESPNSSTASLSTSPGPQPVIQSTPHAPPVPAAPPAPPAPPGPPAPPTPPAAPPVPGGGPPAPPPPPPAPGGGGGTLADQIAAAKLKKAAKADNEGPRSERANSASRGGKAMGGGMDMMAEMQRKLAARKAKEEGREVEPVKEEVESRTERLPSGPRSNVSNPPPAPAFGNNNVKTNFLSTAKPTSNGGIRKNSKSESSLSNDQLEELKSELLAEFRQELDAAKREIIEAVRQEISRLR